MTRIAFFDAKDYDRASFDSAANTAGLEFRYRDFRLQPDTVDGLGEDIEVVCVFVNDKLPRSVIERLARRGVKHIALRCAGFNNVDLQAADELGIVVSRVPAYSPYATAEHAIALLMALNRHIPQANRRVREMNFTLDGLVGFDVHGKTAGVVGTGKIGRIAAEILSGFGTRVLLYDPFPDQAWADSFGMEYVELDSLLAESDIITLHTPLLPSTHHLVNKSTIAKMKRGVYLVNCSRGALVDTKALIKGLKKGQIGGVALDVYEEEEGKFFEDLSGQIMPDDTLAILLSFPNVIVTAHQAFLTREALSAIADVTIENIQRRIAGEEFLPGTQMRATAG